MPSSRSALIDQARAAAERLAEERGYAMSQEDVELLHSIYHQWERGHFWTPEIFAPDVEVVWAADMPDVGTYHGLAGLEEGAREYFAAWDTTRMEAEKFIDLGEQVLVLITAYGRGKASSIETEVKGAHIWTLQDGKATRLVGYSERATALKALGLEGLAMADPAEVSMYV
jgi:ketosteroid isomerase-like protein